jgi:DNA-binding HxlR family transcriptional regulator
MKSTDKICIEHATQILGDKWTPKLVLAIAQGCSGFCKMQNESGINPRTLSMRLSKLESVGILEKKNEKYSLTKKGRDLVPILEHMAAWGAKHYK